MFEYNRSFGLSRVPYLIIIIVLLLVTAVIVAFLLYPFIPNGPAGSIPLIILIIVVIFLRVILSKTGYKNTGSPKLNRIMTLLSFGFASFFGYAALAVVLLGRFPLFPSNVLLLIVVILTSILTALVADCVSQKLGRY